MSSITETELSLNPNLNLICPTTWVAGIAKSQFRVALAQFENCDVGMFSQTPKAHFTIGFRKFGPANSARTWARMKMQASKIAPTLIVANVQARTKGKRFKF